MGRTSLLRLARRGFGLLDQPAGGAGLVVRDEQAGFREVDSDPVGGVSEDLHPQAIGLEDGLQDLGLEPLAFEDHRPAFDPHQSQPSEGSTSAARSAPPREPAAAIMAALSVQSSSGGMVRRARLPTTS